MQVKDTYDRVIDSMRISVTDRRNLRCVYCMPEKGVRPMTHGDVLSYEEIGRLLMRAVQIKPRSHSIHHEDAFDHLKPMSMIGG